MKLIEKLTYGNYDKDIFKISKKLLISSLIIFIIIFIIILFKLPFRSRLNYIIEKYDDSFYQVIVPYDEISIWLDNNSLYYKDKTLVYSLENISDETIFQNDKVYLQILIEVNNFNNILPLVEVCIGNEDITIWEYLNNKFRGK